MRNSIKRTAVFGPMPATCVISGAVAARSLGGRLFYSLFHHEPIQPQKIRAPFEFESNGVDGAFVNMGMGVGLFERCRVKMHPAF